MMKKVFPKTVDNTLRDSLLANGAGAVLKKPYDIKVMTREIRTLLEGDRTKGD